MSLPDSTPSASHFFNNAAALDLVDFLGPALGGAGFADFADLDFGLAEAFFFFAAMGRVGLAVFFTVFAAFLADFLDFGPDDFAMRRPRAIWMLALNKGTTSQVSGLERGRVLPLCGSLGEQSSTNTGSLETANE